MNSPHKSQLYVNFVPTSTYDGGTSASTASSASLEPDLEGCIVDGRFKLDRKLGRHSYGIYIAKNILSGEDIVAKLASSGLERALHHESRILKALSHSQCVGIPRLRWFGADLGCEVLVITRQGPSLEELLARSPSRTFSVEVVAEIACQAISIFESLHTHNIVHRNIKPSHLLLSSEPHNVLHIIDFGLVRVYRHRATHCHIPYRKRLPFAGSVCFASIRALGGKEQSRRDDLESLGYVLLYLLNGSLPWQLPQDSQTVNCNLDIAKVVRAKTDIICSTSQSNIPMAFFSLIEYARSIAFDDRPDYDFVRGLFESLPGDAPVNL